MMLRVCRITPEAEEGRDMMLLDALIQLKEKRSQPVVPPLLP